VKRAPLLVLAVLLLALAGPAAATGDQAAVEQLIEEARALETSDPAAAQPVAAKALELAETLGDPALLAKAQLRLGVAFYLRADYPRAYELYTRSLKRSQEAGSDSGVADAVNNLGILHYLWGDWQVALELYQRSLEMRRRSGDRKGMAVAYNNLGNVAYAAQHYGEALDYYLQSQALYREIGDERYACSSHNNVGLVHLKLGDLAKARASFAEGLSIARGREDRTGIATSEDHLGMLDEEAGDFPAARAAFGRAIALRRELGDRQGLALSLTNLASVVGKEKNPAAAERHLAEALELARQLAIPELERDALELRSRQRAAQGAFESALADTRAAKELQEKIFSEKSGRQLAATRALFELERKDHEIEALKQEKNLQRIATVALVMASLLLLSIVVLLWSRNRLQAQKNQALEAAQRLASDAARAELAHLARVAGLGEMAAAVAHELNQPLAAIITNSQMAASLLEHRTPDIGELAEVVEDITLGARRAWELLRHLRELARKGEIKKEPVEMGALLEETVTIAGAEARLRLVALELDKPPEPLWVEGDRVHLQQILLNLVQNGIDAAAGEAPEHRRLTLEMKAAGKVVEVAATDFGKPVESEVLERMFEPFYTTKFDGLGLGLAICKRLIEALGGELWVRRNPQRGLTVGFRLQALAA
jgi:signal transduction histidine kinase